MLQDTEEIRSNLLMSRSSCPTSLPSKPDFLQNIQFLLMFMSHKKSWPKGTFSNLLKNLVILHWQTLKFTSFLISSIKS